MRAVLDTNVIVAALINPDGAPGRILAHLVESAFTLVLSPSLSDEIRRTLHRPRVRRYVRLSDRAQEEHAAHLETLADNVAGTLELEVVPRDLDDLMVLVTAVEGRADYVVTGDDDLLALGEVEGVAIVSPREFLEVLAG